MLPLVGRGSWNQCVFVLWFVYKQAWKPDTGLAHIA